MSPLPPSIVRVKFNRISRPRSSSSQDISYEKSLEIVRILIGSLIAELAHCRHLLPAQCTSMTMYSPSHLSDSIHDWFYNSHKEPESWKKRGKESLDYPSYRVLIRGIDRRSDTLLSWLVSVDAVICIWRSLTLVGWYWWCLTTQLSCENEFQNSPWHPNSLIKTTWRLLHVLFIPRSRHRCRSTSNDSRRKSQNGDESTWNA